jgi:polar amino acid transport system substrate-binding protein
MLAIATENPSAFSRVRQRARGWPVTQLVSFTTRVLTLAIVGLFSLIALPRLAAAACEPDKVTQKYPELTGKPLRIGTTGDSPPFNYRDPKNLETVVGFNADLMRAVGGCIGIPVQFSVAEFSGLIPGIQGGHIDLAISTIIYLPSRARQVNYIIYMNGTVGAVVKKSSDRTVMSLTDLCGLKVAAAVGSTAISILEDMNKTNCAAKLVQVIATPGGAGGMLLVQNNRADFYLGPSTIQSFDPDLFKIVYTHTTGTQIGVIVQKGKDQLALAVLESMKKSCRPMAPSESLPIATSSIEG